MTGTKRSSRVSKLTHGDISSIARGLCSRLRHEGPVLLVGREIQATLRKRVGGNGETVAHSMARMDADARYWFGHSVNILEIGGKNGNYFTNQVRSLLVLVGMRRNDRVANLVFGKEAESKLKELQRNGKGRWLESFRQV